VCAFMWAGSTPVNITNNSYFAASGCFFNLPQRPGKARLGSGAAGPIRFAQYQANVAWYRPRAHQAETCRPDRGTPQPRTPRQVWKRERKKE